MNEEKRVSRMSRVHKLRLSRLVSCGVNLKIVVRILTRFGCAKKTQTISMHGLGYGSEGKSYPHFLML